MDISKILDDLRQERQHLDEAIVVLERLVSGSGGKRRGRPPNWLKRVGAIEASGAAPAKVGGRKKFGDETRRKMAESQKRRWEAKNAAKNS